MSQAAKYLRTVSTIDGTQIGDVRYRSARENVAKSLVLFATQDNVILPPSRQPQFYSLDRDRWIKLSLAKATKILHSMPKRWKSRLWALVAGCGWTRLCEV